MTGIACMSVLLESQIRPTKLLSVIPGANHVFKNLNWLFCGLCVGRPHIFIKMKGVFYIGSADGFRQVYGKLSHCIILGRLVCCAKLPFTKPRRVTACDENIKRIGDNSVTSLEIIVLNYSSFHEQTKLELKWLFFALTVLLIIVILFAFWISYYAEHVSKDFLIPRLIS